MTELCHLINWLVNIIYMSFVLPEYVLWDR